MLFIGGAGSPAYCLFNVVSVQELKEVVDLAFNRLQAGFDVATAN